MARGLTESPGKRRLRVAVLSPIGWRTPPSRYGPWELFASLLTEALVQRGHAVTLFATGDSITTARLVSTVPHGWSDSEVEDTKVAECLHIASCFERADHFDVIHNGFDFLPLTYSRLIDTPLVTTIHGFSSEAIVPVYQRYNDRGSYVAISDADRHPSLRYHTTIHHGVDLSSFPYSATHDGYLLFFGRIHPDKGTAEAIEVARLTGRVLIIAGIVHDQEYFDRRIAPQIDGVAVRYVGAVGGSDRANLLGRAAALLHLISFDEPFGFSVVEAMACGTPVVAFKRGSMTELIGPDCGLLVADVDGAVRAISQLESIDRSAVRAWARSQFSVESMAEQYERVYFDVLSQ